MKKKAPNSQERTRSKRNKENKDSIDSNKIFHHNSVISKTKGKVLDMFEIVHF
jgi:hypothetical protein